MTRRLAALALATSVLAGCAGPEAGERTPGSTDVPPGPIPLVIDTDMSSDDIMAIAWLTTSSAYEIRAITVVGTGVVHCGPGVRNARALLRELNHAVVRVACGPTETPPGGRPVPDVWRLEADRAFGLTLAAGPDTETGDAAPLIREVVTESSGPVAILALGPLTNIAAALAADSGDEGPPAGIGPLVIVGGAVGVPGNASSDGSDAAAEWNVAADPQAAAAVLASGLAVTLVPLDASNHLPLTQDFVDRLRVDVDAGPAGLVDELLTRNRYLVGASSFGDPLGAVALVDPSVVTLEIARISVVVDGPEAGRTRSTPDGAVVALAIAADQEAFETVFLAGLRRGPPRATPLADATPSEDEP